MMVIMVSFDLVVMQFTATGILVCFCGTLCLLSVTFYSSIICLNDAPVNVLN